MKSDQLSSLRNALRVFAKDREWEHSAIAVSVEAAELLEVRKAIAEAKDAKSLYESALANDYE